MDVRVIQAIGDVAPAAWNGLRGTDNPFLRHEFLHALEQHGCVHPDNGWQPFHLLLYDADRLLAASPMYLKGHSWGEFVFDWSWADAHARRGLPYYPKLVAAVPYSPVTGPRILLAEGVDAAAAAAALGAAARELALNNGLSSVHWLFPQIEQAEHLVASGYALRTGYQFHWSNTGYASFDDFLGAFSSKKRKNVRQERARVRESGIDFVALHGAEVSRQQWKVFDDFYRRTFHAHGNVPVLNAAFLQDVAAALSDRLLLVLGRHRGDTVAGALFLRSSDTLYGRYWGSSIELSGLHFETCYYQGIDYCIRHGLTRFEPGAQGEHKVARGFLPARTQSAHWLRDNVLRHAVDDFLRRERAHVDAYLDEMHARSPYRTSDS
jgi:predicted N-acyltransferase